MSAELSPTGGKHKIFLGYAPGVGKTYAMLEEAARRAARGKRVVAGVLSKDHKPATAVLASAFTPLPSLRDAIGGPYDYVLVDDLSVVEDGVARWQTVEEILASKISVLSTVNVANLESLNDLVAEITGERVTETVPDRILHDAYEVEIVDVTVRALLNRLDRGDIFPLDEVPALKEGLFREGNLVALREVALREAAGKVDEDLDEYRKAKRIEKPWAAIDRVLVCISPTRPSLRLIRRAWRMGHRMHAQVLAVHVDDGEAVNDPGRKILDDDFALAQRLGIETLSLKGELAATLVQYAREHNVTQIVLGHPERSRLQHMLKPSILSELVRELKTVDFVVVAHESGS